MIVWTLGVKLAAMLAVIRVQQSRAVNVNFKEKDHVDQTRSYRNAFWI